MMRDDMCVFCVKFERLKFKKISFPRPSYSTTIPTSKWMNIRKYPNLISIPLPRRTQALPNSLYSPSKRKTDLSYSISESHARQKHLYDATPTRSKEVTTSSFSEKKKAGDPRGVQLSPSPSRPPLPKKKMKKSSSVYPTWNNR